MRGQPSCKLKTLEILGYKQLASKEHRQIKLCLFVPQPANWKVLRCDSADSK